MTLLDAMRILELAAPITLEGVDRAGHAAMQRLEDLVRRSPEDADLSARAQAHAGEVRAAHAFLRERPTNLYPYHMVATPPEQAAPTMAFQAPAPVPVVSPAEAVQPAGETATQARSTPPPLPPCPARMGAGASRHSFAWQGIMVGSALTIVCGVCLWYGYDHFYPSGRPVPGKKGDLGVKPAATSEEAALRGISTSDAPAPERRLVVKTAADGSMVAHMPDGSTIRQSPGGNRHGTYGPKGSPFGNGSTAARTPRFLATGADAQFLREGAPDAGPDPAARARLKRIADTGDAEAQYLLAKILLFPPSPPSDAPEGLRLLEKADAQKHRMASYTLACTYLDGIGRPADPKKGVSMLKSLTDGRSFPVADLRLADCHRDGLGVPYDYEYALSIYNHWQSVPSAQYRLSLMYEHGCGVTKDDAEALKWLQIAVAASHAPALYQMGLRHAKGLGVPQDNAQAAEEYMLAAKLDYAPAQAALGRCYHRARGVPFEGGLAIHYYQQAALQGFPHAQDYLGSCYAEGECIWKDPKQASGWYAKAATQGHGPAQMHLGRFLLEDHPGLSADPVRALAWFLRAESQDEEGAAEMVLQTREQLSPYDIAEAERVSAELPRTTAWNQWQPFSP